MIQDYHEAGVLGSSWMLFITTPIRHIVRLYNGSTRLLLQYA